jgi:hypothetical protein
MMRNKKSKGPLNHGPFQSTKSDGILTSADTSKYKEGYGGVSTAYTFIDSKEARHVDMRPTVGRSETESLRTQLRPVKWTEDLGFEAARQFRKNYDVSSIKNEEVRNHAALMLERLTFQKVHYRCDGPTPQWMVEQSLLQGPRFTAAWASAWKEGRFKWTECERIEPVEKKEFEIEFNNYNTTYPPFFFIFWEEDSDDWEYMMRDTPFSDPETLEQLQIEVAALSEELISEEDLAVVPDEVIYNPVSSNGFENAERSRPEWEIEFKSPEQDDISDHLVFLRGQARKRPSEVREIGTMTPQSMRAHRRIMYPMQKACRRIPDCVYGRDQGFIKSQVEVLGKHNNWFYMRDYAKSGMTIPHAVRNAVLAGFYQRRPDLVAKYTFAFDKQVLHIKEGDSIKQVRPTNGMPLGMFVEGFTLLQYAVHRIISRTLGYNLKFSATNDDMIVASRSEDKLREYVIHDMFIQSDLGMLVKATKSGICHNRFFFCEEYWDYDHLMSKEVLTVMSLLGAKYAINIVHAKELVYSILLSYPYRTEMVKKAISEVQTCYEYEFTDQEISWPYLFGGWVPHVRDGLDISVEWRNGDAYADAAYWACREKPKHKRNLENFPTLTYGRKKQIRLLKRPEHESDYLSLIPLFGTKGALEDYYTLLSRRPASLRRYYHELFIARQRCYVQINKGTREPPAVMDGYLRRHPNSVITLDMIGLVARKPVGTISKPQLGFKVSSGDAWLSCMEQLGFIEYPDSVKVSKTEKLLHSFGLTDELKYEKLNVPERGSSTFIIKNHVKGLDLFQQKTGLAIERIDSEDLPFNLTKKWIWAPDLPLQWVVRCMKYSRPYPDFEFSEETGLWWTSFVQDKHSKLESWGEYEDPVVEFVPDTSSFEEVIIDYLANMLDGAAIQIKAKLIPLASSGAGAVNNSEQVPQGIDAGLIQMGEGNWVPASLSDQPSFWDNSGSDDEVGDWFGG